VSEAFEVSPDDAPGVAEAIRRAAHGAVVHLVRDGQPVADIVPAQSSTASSGSDPDDPGAGTADDSELDASAMKALEARMATRPAVDVDAGRIHAQRFGAPTLAHYRAVYAQAGAPWPGEAFIRRHHPVADAAS
jgi:antitoxin (DNA-binding transcriptional repressor) of toxin-antitoxin stability system